MLLDAVICHYNRSHKKSISHDQAFNQHAVFRASVLAECRVHQLQDAVKNSYEFDSSKRGEEGEVALEIDEQWFSMTQLREKLLGTEHDGGTTLSSNKRWVIVEGKLPLTYSILRSSRLLVLCTNLSACGDLKLLFEKAIKEICLSPDLWSIESPPALSSATTVPEDALESAAAIEETVEESKMSSSSLEPEAQRPPINETKLRIICAAIYKGIQK